MAITEIAVFIGLATFIVATQLGRRQLSLRRLAVPLVAVGLVGYHYLRNIPTTGGDLNFEVSLGLAGALCGVLAASLMMVERDEQTGRVVTEAGMAYAALWGIVFGGRLAFAWGASHLWSHQVMTFSLQHAITGTAAWTAAFVLMALAMVTTRTLIVGARAALLETNLPLHLGNRG